MAEAAWGGLAASTVWVRADPALAAREPGAVAAGMAEALGACRLGAVELEYRLTAEVLARLLPELAARGIRPVSLHNYVPVPDILTPDMASGDAFNLASRDPDERRLAVDYTTRSLELASELEVGALVVHLGWVAGLEDKGLIRRAAENGGGPELDGHLARRARLAGGHLDAVSFALERLLDRAGPLGVSLAVENRYHAYQIPSFDEVGLLLERFRGGAIAYWHDVGHAHVQQLAGLAVQRDWLDAYGPRLAGCHLHDAQGWRDHQLPGHGELDWDALAPLVAAAPRLVLEVAESCAPRELAEAAAWLWAKLDASRRKGSAEAPASSVTASADATGEFKLR